jgi:hypothetical protein
VVAAVLVTALVQVVRQRGTRLPVGALLAPVGLLGYVGWVGLRVGAPAGYFHVARGWGNGFDGGRAFASWTRELLSGSLWPQGVLVVLGVAVLVGLLALAVRDGQPLPLLVFAGVLLVLALCTSGYFGSKPRYLLPAFPLLMPVALRLSRAGPRPAAVVLGVLAAGSATYGATWLLGPGPP